MVIREQQRLGGCVQPHEGTQRHVKSKQHRWLCPTSRRHRHVKSKPPTKPQICGFHSTIYNLGQCNIQIALVIHQDSKNGTIAGQNSNDHIDLSNKCSKTARKTCKDPPFLEKYRLCLQEKVSFIGLLVKIEV